MTAPFVAELAGLAFGLAGLVAILVFRPWRWMSEWLQDLWDDWDWRLSRWRRSGALRFPSGMIFGLVLGAVLMGLWAPVLQRPSAHHAAEGLLEPASVTRSQAMHPDVAEEVDPLAARLQVGEPVRTAPEAVDSNMVVEVEAFSAGPNAPEPNPSWPAPVLTNAAPEVIRGLAVSALSTPSNADPPPRLPIRAQVVLAPPPDLSPAPAETLATITPEQARPASSSVRSPRGAPSLALDLSQIELVQPVEALPEPTLPEPSHQVAVAYPVTPALTVPEPEPEIVIAPEPPVNESAVSELRAEETTLTEPSTPEIAATGINETEPPLSALRPRGPVLQTTAAEPVAPLIRPRSRDEVRAAQPPEAEAAPPVQVEAPQCNIQGCAAAYQSFRASDCTYQPYEGPRQLCTR